MRLPFAFSLLVALGSGCGTDATETSPPAGDASDDRYHPPPDGQHISESAACDSLASKLEAKRLMLGCLNTGRLCPDFLRASFVTECLEYDQGSVDGCIDHYDEQMTCEALTAAVKNCVITAYPGTEPNGC